MDNVGDSRPVLKTVVFFIVAAVLIVFQLFARDFEVISNPKPTCVENDYAELVKVKEITEEIDDEHFLAKPLHLALDDEGNLYVLDAMLVKIFKFDPGFRLVKMFLNEGRGPGEITHSCPGKSPLYFSKDGHLYVLSPYNRKIIAFNKSGKVTREIRIEMNNRFRHFCPVVDLKGNVYTLSAGNGAVDVFEPSMKPIKTLLKPGVYKKMIIFEPTAKTSKDIFEPGELNTFYDVLPDNGFIIYIANSSTVFLFKDHQPVKSFNIWPKQLFENYKVNYEKDKKQFRNTKWENGWFKPFMMDFFVDKDDERFFYIDTFAGYRDLYKFDMNGKLVLVLRLMENASIIAKRNGFFYGIDKRNGKILAFKEVKK
jgi:hypothetical protein